MKTLDSDDGTIQTEMIDFTFNVHTSVTRFLESIVLKRIIQETHVISLKPCIL